MEKNFYALRDAIALLMKHIASTRSNGVAADADNWGACFCGHDGKAGPECAKKLKEILGEQTFFRVMRRVPDGLKYKNGEGVGCVKPAKLVEAIIEELYP